MEFGSLDSSRGYEKPFQLLNYHALLQILFSSYMPHLLFSEAKEISISFSTWKNMVKEVSPVLAVLQGQKTYQLSWRDSLHSLFKFADSFLYSSNRDGALSSKELFDLTAHLLEGVKSVSLANEKIKKNCTYPKDLTCRLNTFFKDKELWSVYPRFQNNFSVQQVSKYRKHAEFMFNNKEEVVSPIDFLPLLILLQVAELNYNLIDQNQSFRLESDELFAYTKKIKKLARKIPYIFNQEQAQSYLMYSFYSGNVPFFTGPQNTSLEFVNWHLNSKPQKSFSVSFSDFHFLVLDFYKVYKQYETFL